MDRRIAVVGMAGRFPDASDLSEFYHNLQQAKCSVGEISAERVRRTTLDPGAAYHRRGYLENIDEFDHQFFNIPYGEAIHMDPHQRLLLEVVAEAIENCGYSLQDFNNTNTAVYVADKRLQYYEHAEQFDPTLVTGNSSEFLAARINRVFNLKGGVAVIDTSCSSALVAIHNACNELRLGYADQALVCGVNLELFPAKNGQYHIEVDSPDGFSIPFTAASNGMVYGEAVVCVVLKPLMNALQDKDNIQAVITGSAVNNNAAAAASLTAPDSIAQSEVLRKAWAQAGIEPGMLAFIEAHGSGTQLGDSLEIAGINMAVEAYGHDRLSIPVSTVKSNIGHTRSTAGLAGFVKAVLEIKHKTLLPSVYVDPPNPHLQLKNARVRIQRNVEAWKMGNCNKMIGGISSIGFSGTNCHVVVEQSQKPLNGHRLTDGNQPFVFLFSSWKEQELLAYIERTAHFLARSFPSLEDLSFTLGRRDHYQYRKAFVAGSIGELRDALAAYAGDAAQPGNATAHKLIFIFSPGDHIDYSMVEDCCKSSRYFSDRYQFYLDKVSIGIERTAPQIFRFIFQLAYHDLLVHNGIETATLLGIGTGQLIARVVRNELSVEEALQKAYEYKPAQDVDNGLQAKLEKLLQQQSGAAPVFMEMGMGSELYPLLLKHAGNGSTFFTYPLSTALPVMDIAAMQAFLYQHNFAAPRNFFNNQQGKRIELPAHPFSKIRCWIREEPKKPATAAAQQQAAPKQRDIVYANTVQGYVSALWRSVLELPAGTATDHFFEAGGDSIKATKVIRQLNEAFDTRLDFEDLFDYPSLQAFAGLISSMLSVKHKLMLIWKDVLGYANLQETDNFFEKGGHSLLANQVLNRMKAEMKLKIDFEDFFSHPSVQLMADFLERRNLEVADETIPVIPPAADYPASHLQRRLWILSQLEESSVAYNEFNAFNLEGPLNVKALQQAIALIIQRHEAFRTIFTDGPRQQVLPYSAIFDMLVEYAPASEQELMKQVRAFAVQPFVLSAGPLVRTKLICLPNSKYIFLFNIHHIIFDEWSNQLFIKELVQAYTALCSGNQPALQPLRVQYKDYAAWLQHNSSSGSEYWQNLLKNDAPALELPLDFTRPPVKTYNGSALNIELPTPLKKAIEGMAVKNSASTFMALTAITSLLLHRYSGQPTVLLGTPVVGRKDVEMESCVGFFANTVVLKTTIDGTQPFASLLAAVKQQVAAAYTHQLYPFDLLVEQLDLTPDRSRTPLFDVMIGYQKNAGVSNTGFEMQGVKVTAFGQPRETSKFDLLFDFFETADGLSLTITYNTDLFLPVRIQRMAQHFCTLVEKLHAQQALPLKLIDYRMQDDVAIEHAWQQPAAPVNGNAYQLFLQQVQERPLATAIDSNGRQLSYQQLHEKSQHVAACLAKWYVAGERVHVQLDDVAERITVMLALAQLGAQVVLVSSPDVDKTITSDTRFNEPSSFTAKTDRFSISAEEGEAISLIEYIEWFNENIPAVAGQKYWMNSGVSARWIENAWAALATGLTLMQSNEQLTEADGLVLTAQELQLLKPPSPLQWILVDGYLANNRSANHFMLRPGPNHEAIATVVGQEIKPLPHVAVRVSDKQQIPAPAGIDGLLSFKTRHDWQHTGIACRWNSAHELLLTGHEVVRALLEKPTIGQLAVSPLEQNTVFITPATTRTEAPKHEALYEFKPATEEEIKLLESINATDKELPGKTLVQYLQQWASMTPDKIALRCGTRSMSFAELNQASGIIAQQLLLRGVRHEEIVPIFAERSTEFIACILGIMKAGAVYLPFGMDIPISRMAGIVQDCGARFMLVRSKDQSARFSAASIENIGSLVQQLDLDQLLSEPLQPGIEFPATSMSDLAYVLYTSGSTGKPKGVMIEHAGLMNNLHYKVAAFNIGIHTKVIQNAPQSFDISIWQLLTTIVAGAQTIVYPDAIVENPAAFVHSLVADEADILEVVPSYLNMLLDILEEDAAARTWKPKYLLVTGEAFAPKLASRWFASYPGVTLVNAYGPTEASDDITFYFFNSIDENLPRIPIGQPIMNTKIYVVNESMQLCGLGGVGEICVSGIGVGRGYLGQPERTRQVFVDDPWQPGTRMYKTGDLGYFNENGILEFIGRKDHQVKVNGNRVETAEIEHCICLLAGVQQAVVLAFKGADKNDFLAAWLQAPDAIEVRPEAVKAMIREKLPPYMLPSYVFVRNELPLSSNGKIDRKAFPNPELYKRSRAVETEARQSLAKQFPDSQIPTIIAVAQLPLTVAGLPDWNMLQELVWSDETSETVPPATGTEKIIAGIWEQVLNVQHAGIDDDFFEKGGYSLKGIRMLAAIEEKLGRRLTLRNLFSAPTIRQLAAMVDRQQQQAAMHIPVQPQQQYYPVSFAQRRMWVMSRLGNQQHAYNSCGALQLKGVLNKQAWDACWNQLIARHEILRTGFSMVEGEVMQYVLPAVDAVCNITQLDISAHPDPLHEVHAIHRAHEQMEFDLERAPLLRGTMVRIAPNEYVFIYVLHHIICDEWSMQLLSKELLLLYDATANNKVQPLSPLEIQYRDYACWQRNEEQEHWKQSSAYWKQKLQGPLPVLELPIDGARPAVKTYAGSSELATMRGTSAQLIATGAGSGATLFMTLVAAVKIFLQRYCHQQDIIIGTPVAGRDHAQLQNGVGLYLNTMALRTAVDAEDSFYDVLKKVRATTLEAFEHQDYPFDKLVEELEIKKDLSRSALFDVLLVQHDEATPVNQPARAGGLEIKPYGIPPSASKFDLGFHFRQNGDDLDVGINYNTALFSADRAKMLLAHFQQLLSGLLNKPAAAIQSIDYTSSSEKNILLRRNEFGWNAAQNICERMAQAWAEKMEQPVLAHLTYRELDEQSTRMANHLKANNIGVGNVVALYMNRSVELVISLLGIIKAGATYLPLDKSFPAQRVDFMLSDSDAVLVISDEAWAGEQNCMIWNDALRSELSSASPASNSVDRTPESIAYIIYTSGTSGKPKGVRITDKGLVHYAAGIEAAYQLKGRQLRGLLASSAAFDLGYTCLWGMLLLGGELHLLPQTPYWQPQQVLECIEDKRINFIKLTPSHFRLLVHETTEQPQFWAAAEHLQWIILGGEKSVPADMQQWLNEHPHCRIANHYGPTETAIGVLTQLISAGGNEVAGMDIRDFAIQPVLGEPMGANNAYITDANGMLCGTGVWGELLVSSPGISPGYLNRPELTAQKFIDDPFNNGQKLYKTGDRCRWLLNGKIEFSGRLDAQVQLKGYRVEPEEIENVLLQLQHIAQAAVVTATVHNEEHLVAYVVTTTEDVVASQDELRAHVASHLPAYMVPWKFIQLATMPLTGNGKTDRRQLPDPSLFDSPASAPARAAKNKAEEALLEAFALVMPNRQIAPASNFFELGGDSIKAIQLASKLYVAGWKLDIRAVFEHPVLEQMANYMQVVKQGADQRPVEGEVLLSPIQHDFFQRGFLFEHHYNQAVLLKATQRLETKSLMHAIKKLFTHHDALRMVYRLANGNLQQYNRGLEIETEVFDIDLRQVDDPVNELTHQCQQLQEGFDLEQGPLLKAAIFRLPEDDRLLLVAHHLVVDGVSWRILLEDLGLLYEQANNGQELRPGPKTASFKTWTEQLHALAASPGFAEENAYWHELPANEQQLIWPAQSSGKQKDRVITGFELDEAHTGLLLSSVQHAYNTEINEIFLSALSWCIAGIYDMEEIWLAMEGHGRENIVDADVSRTVGWFTSIYPVLLRADSQDAGAHIRQVKEQLRRIPQKGMGYGMLKYLSGNHTPLQGVQPEIVFNYLGQFESAAGNELFSFATENAGGSSNDEEKIPYALAITGRVLDEKLRMNFEFDPLRVSAADQDAICLQFEKHLLQIIYHCASRKETEHTASDFQYKLISQETFETLFD